MAAVPVMLRKPITSPQRLAGKPGDVRKVAPLTAREMITAGNAYRLNDAGKPVDAKGKTVKPPKPETADGEPTARETAAR
jgi:hypothetical protein